MQIFYVFWKIPIIARFFFGYRRCLYLRDIINFLGKLAALLKFNLSEKSARNESVEVLQRANVKVYLVRQMTKYCAVITFVWGAASRCFPLVLPTNILKTQCSLSPYQFINWPISRMSGSDQH